MIKLILFCLCLYINISLYKSKDLSLSQRLLKREEWEKHFSHPFLLAMQSRTLSKAKWIYYAKQDALFLREYIKVNAMAVSRSRSHPEFVALAEQLSESIDFYDDFLEANNFTNADIAGTPFADTNFAFTRFMLSVGATGTLEEIVTAMLPTIWIYEDIEREMNISFVPTGSPQSQSCPDRQSTDSLNFYRTFLDEYDGYLRAGEEERLQSIFDRVVKYEYDFWDMAWNYSS